MTSSAIDDFTSTLCAYIESEVSVGDDPIEPHTDLVMTGLVDSLGVVLIVEWLESRLEIEIDPGDVVLEHFESVAAIAGYATARGALDAAHDSA